MHVGMYAGCRWQCGGGEQQKRDPGRAGWRQAGRQELCLGEVPAGHLPATDVSTEERTHTSQSSLYFGPAHHAVPDSLLITRKFSHGDLKGQCKNVKCGGGPSV